MDRQLESRSMPSAVLKNPCQQSTMQKLYENRGMTGDIKFVVDGEEIRAHRYVLAAFSPRYEAQFYGALAQKDSITIDDVSPAAFNEFLQFCYTEKVTLTLDNIEDVLNLAKQSLVDELVAECANFLMTVIGMDKLLWCYRLARFYDMQRLMAFCENHIGVNIEQLFQTADFMRCERDMLCHILDLDSLNCRETEVFKACIAWSQAKCGLEGIDATNTANLRAALGEALFKIRFCSMKAEGFATINRQYSRLLSPQESIDVCHAIESKGNGVRSGRFGEKNSMPRQTVQYGTNGVVSFAKGQRVPYNSTTGNCFIDFTTDKAITVYGFIFCNRIDDFIVVQTFSGLNGEANRHTFVISKTENETKIKFINPVQVPAHERCMIRVDSRALNTSLYGFDLEDQVTQNGVTFKVVFHARPNPITRLLFEDDA